jgi:NAD+ kinase
MEQTRNLVRRLIIAAHPGIPDALPEAHRVAKYLTRHALEHVEICLLHEKKIRELLDQLNPDILVALGGDGTMLRAGSLCGPRGVPVLGINLGRFGFLIEVARTDWETYIDQLVEGNFRVEERMMLSACLVREEKCLESWDVLNEVVVCRGQIVRPIHLQTHVDGRLMANYVADGLIASTPTGSTAYALAAGGPILPPDLNNILIVPIAPHLSIDRAIILPQGACVTIQVQTNHEAVVSADGRTPTHMIDGDWVEISRAGYNARFVRFSDPGYFYRNISTYMEQNPAMGKK